MQQNTSPAQELFSCLPLSKSVRLEHNLSQNVTKIEVLIPINSEFIWPNCTYFLTAENKSYRILIKHVMVGPCPSKEKGAILLIIMIITKQKGNPSQISN